MPQSGHNFLHHMITVFVVEVNSLFLFAVGGCIALVGYMIFDVTEGVFYKMVVGMPLIIFGIALFFLKFNEILLAIFVPSRIKNICVICDSSH